MPVKDGAQFLAASITDIEANVLADDEILVIDDGSKDETGKILKAWANRNASVRVITTKGGGLVEALNLGVSEANNEWVARFDVDDRYVDSRILEQRKAISNGCSAIFCDYKFNDPKGNKLGVIPTAVNAHATVVSLLSSQRTPHPGVIFNRKAVLEAGGYRKEDFPAEDISLWLRLAKTGKMISIPQILLEYRLSKHSVTAKNRLSAKLRTIQLVNEIGISEDHIFYCLNNWRTIFENYSDMSYSAERRLLLYRDLNKGLQFIAKSESMGKQKREILYHLLNDKKTIKAFSHLLVEKTQRKIYREY